MLVQHPQILTIIDGEALHKQGSEAGSRAAAEGVEDEESLEAGALIG